MGAAFRKLSLLLLGGWTASEWLAERAQTEEISLSLLLWKAIPVRTISAIWGYLNRLELPTVLRDPIIGGYARLYGCNLGEAAEPLPSNYKNLNAFFTRQLAPRARPINAGAALVSCCDGKVLAVGQLEGSTAKISQPIKGLDLTAETLIGQPVDAGKKLHFCIIYLAPGDYHRFHAPADVTFSQLNHYNGELMSVNPSFLRYFSSVLKVNERVGLVGRWRYGFFSYCPVAATGVGNISIAKAADLQICKSITRQRGWARYPVSLAYDKGEEIGMFEIGSTVALVFEAPPGFEWTLPEGSQIRVGAPLGRIK